jgi:hypothetical protein
MTYDPIEHRLLLFGGKSATGLGNDTWLGAVLVADNDSQLAGLTGGNTFSGNQTINGTLAATSLVGNGSGLTGVNADFARTAGDAQNAGALGGVPAPSYARVDRDNDFNGNQSIAGNLVANGISGNLVNASAVSANSVAATATVNAANVVVAANTSTGTLTTAGTVTIGTGGTPIAEYVSTTYSATLPALTSGSCTTFTTAALTGFTPGASDTIALGLPTSLVSSLGAKIFLIYQAWETTTTPNPTLTIQVCNPSGVRYAGGATDTIRIDIFKH